MEHIVNLPEEDYSILEFIQEDLPGVAAVNISLRNFKPKKVFSWHLSIMIKLEELIENGMPSESEVVLLNSFEDELDEMLKGADIKKPNAIFLARITWNRTSELIWRVHDPELVNSDLQKIIKDKSHPRFFDFRIDPDEEWKLTEWHLQD